MFEHIKSQRWWEILIFSHMLYNKNQCLKVFKDIAVKIKNRIKCGFVDKKWKIQVQINYPSDQFCQPKK